MPDICEVPAAAVVGLSEGESRGDPVAGLEEVFHPNATLDSPGVSTAPSGQRRPWLVSVS